MKLTKKLTALIIIAGTSFQAFSGEGNGVAGIYILGGLHKHNNWEWESVDRFLVSFNEYNAHRLEQGFTENFLLNNSFSWGVELRAGFILGHIRERSETSYNAFYLNGEQRDINLTLKYSETYLSGVLPLFDFLDAGVLFGFATQKGKLSTGYTYTNGYRSLGGDKWLNGIYNLKQDIEILTGFRLDFGYKRYRLTCRWNYTGLLEGVLHRDAFNEDEYGYDGIAIEDYGKSNSLALAGNFDDGDLRFYIPEDYSNITNSNAYLIGSERCVFDNFSGWSFSIMLSIGLVYSEF